MKFTKTLKSMAMAAVFSVGAMGFGNNAQADTLSEFILGNGGGDLAFKYVNRDMGTIYDFTNGTTYSDTGDPMDDLDINNPDNIASQALGAATINGIEEDTWGIANVTTLDVGDDGSGEWFPGVSNGKYLTIMFWGGYDIETSVDGDIQRTFSVNVHMDIYESDAAPDLTLGSSGRTGDTTYTGITDGNLVLSLESTGGFFADNLFGEFLSNFNLTATNGDVAGDGQAYFSVTGGAWAANFDTDTYVNGAAGTADVYVRFTTDINDPVSASDDWLVTSDDPARAYVVPLPGAASMGFIK